MLSVCPACVLLQIVLRQTLLLLQASTSVGSQLLTHERYQWLQPKDVYVCPAAATATPTGTAAADKATAAAAAACVLLQIFDCSQTDIVADAG